jgi:hypothetical protein
VPTEKRVACQSDLSALWQLILSAVTRDRYKNSYIDPLCCQAVGITRETFYDWRRDDPAFAEQVDRAAAKGSLGRLKKIEQHGKKDWRAYGWMPGRRHPEHFARADALLSVNQTVATGPGNVVVVGPERARVLATRHQQIRAKIIALLEKFDKRSDAVLPDIAVGQIRRYGAQTGWSLSARAGKTGSRYCVRFRGRIVSRHRSLALAQRESSHVFFAVDVSPQCHPIVKVPAQQYWPG